MNALPDYDDSLDELKRHLAGDIERLAIALLGEPNRTLSSKSELRFGSKGSVSVVLRGKKRGTWFDHSAGIGGGPLDLIMHARSCDIRDAIAWARDWTGGRISVAPPPRPARKPDAGPDDDEVRRIAKARQLWREAVPIAGTVAERYLVEARAIPAPADGWPSKVVRYHASTQSLIVAATLSDGTVQQVQRVHLTPEARKLSKAEAEARKLSVKQTNGVGEGAVVRLPGDSAGPLLLAEGPETGLTVWRATGAETWVALGSVTKIEPPPGRELVICADDDPRKKAGDGKAAPAHKARQDAIRAWCKAGFTVHVVYPWETRRQDKSDFNDLARGEGIEAVQRRIEAQVRPTAAAVQRMPIEQARDVLAEAVGNFTRAAWDWDERERMMSPVAGAAPEAAPFDEDDDWLAPLMALPPPARPDMPVHAIKVEVGGGKSEAARHGLVSLVLRMRAADDTRSVAIAVPTHKLGDEQADKIRGLPGAEGLTVAVWRGRGADDPQSPGRTMCGDPERVHDAQEAMQDVQSACCDRPGRDGGPRIRCPLFDACAYQAQRKQKADIWIVAHHLLFNERPRAMGKLVALVVDENAWRNGLKGTEGHPIRLSLDALGHDDTVPGDSLASLDLRSLRQTVLDALHYEPEGPIQREVLLATGLTAARAKEARGLEWRRKLDAGLHPGMTSAERREAVEATAINRGIVHLSMFWTAIERLLSDGGPQASGWAAIETYREKDATTAGQVRVLRLKGRTEITEGWRVPTLILDAVLQPELARFLWPTLQVVADVAVEAPHQRVVQVMDRSYSKAQLIGRGAGDKAEAGHAVSKLRLQLIHMARQAAPGGVLAVCQKAVEAAIKAEGPLPDNLDLAHHNAIAGRDEWRDVRLIIVVGRTQPPPGAVSAVTEALTGSAMPLLDGWYDRADAVREMADGAELAEFDRHPDPVAEAVRWSICEAELVQIIGRGRGVNRTADKPLDVLVMTDVPLPLPVAETINAAALDLTLAEQMQAMGGVSFDNAAHAWRAYPTMWPSFDAARQALLRARSATSPIRYSLNRECRSPLIRVAYQVGGAGQKRAACEINLAVVPDPAVWLAERLGPLAWCDIEQQPRKMRARAVYSDDVVHDTPTMAEPPAAEPGLAPGALYRRGVLDPPPADVLTIRGRCGRAIAGIEAPAFGPCMAARPITAAGLGAELVMRRWVAENETGLRLAGDLLPMLASSAIGYQGRMLSG